MKHEAAGEWNKTSYLLLKSLLFKSITIAWNICDLRGNKRLLIKLIRLNNSESECKSLVN